MELVDLNVKDYIKKQTNNIAFEHNGKSYFISQLKSNKPNHLYFNDIYKLYSEFKKLGKRVYMSQDGILNKIKFHDKDIILNWPFISEKTISFDTKTHVTNYINNMYTFNNEDIGLTDMALHEIASFAELIYLCSDSIKHFCTKGINDLEEIEESEKKFRRIISIYENDIELAFSLNDISKIPEIITKLEIKNPYLVQIKEELVYNDLFEVIEPYIMYNNIMSTFFHFFKLEIVYYTYIKEGERKKPKLCPICGKYTIGKCKCMTVSASYRRNQNKKCARLRNKLEIYLNTYYEIIPVNYRMKAERMLEQANEGVKHWQDLNELRRICYNIEKNLKETK